MLYDIPKYEGYKIDLDSNVYTTFITKPVNGKNERVLLDSPKKLSVQKNRYCTVTLYDENGRHTEGIHNLMLSVFEKERPNGKWGLHKDGNTYNNKLSNLYWGTPQDNSNDRILHGNSGKGVLNPRAKLNEKQIRVIRHAYNLGSTQCYLAKVFNVHQTQISRILLKKAWKEA